MPELLSAYIPRDRRDALGRGENLPDIAYGAALFADISGFTPLTEALTRTFGPRRGVEELTRHLNRVYDTLIDEANRFGGSVISFAGDAITCWFDSITPNPALRATACALSMQVQMQAFKMVRLPNGESVTLAMKVSIASGPARRFMIGDPTIQYLDILAGETLANMALGEHLAQQGEVLVDEPTSAQLGGLAQMQGWRVAEGHGGRYGCVTGLNQTLADFAVAAEVSNQLRDEEARAWLLPPVYERLQADLGDILTELRPAVALFVRFEGIDYDRDDNAGLKLNQFICWVQGILAKYEGYLLQLIIGDKGSSFYAAFGAPLAHEDDARRAVNAAADLCNTLPPELSFIRSLHVGVNQGTMRAGAYGSMLRRTYGVLGDAVNLAARLMQHAGAGEVLVTEPIQRATRADFAWAELPLLQVKGKSEAVQAFRLLGRQQGRAEASRYTGALVGRETELAQLATFCQPIFEGQFAGVMYVHGEPGMGKSRLLYEARQALEQAHRVLWCICPSEGILRKSLNPLQYFLHEYFDLGAAEDENKTRFDLRLDALIADLRRPDFPAPAGVSPVALADELDRTRSFLGALADDLRWEGSLYEQLEPRLRLENTLSAAKTIFLAESLRQPVVVQVEDAHVLDPDSEAFVRMLTRNVEAYPLALIVAARYRDDDSHYVLSVDTNVPQAMIDLNRLTPTGVQAMASQVLNAEAAPDLAAFLNAKTNGNPFFLEQLVLDLRERGLLVVKPATASQSNPMVDLSDQTRVEEVPASITAVLVARLDRLTAHVKAVVQTAAVLGQEFEVQVLSQMLQNDPRLDQRVKQAETEAIWAPLNELRYLFKHALLRDAAYDMQLQERVRELHALAGTAIETIYIDDLTPQAALLAYHWAMANHEAKEAHYSAIAGEQAARTSAFRDALRYFTRVLGLLESGRVTEAALSPARLHYSLGETYAGLGELRDAQRHFQVSLEAARAINDRPSMAQALSFLGGTTQRLGEIDQAEADLQEALLIAHEIQNERARASILYRLGQIANARGAYDRAKQLYEESLALARDQNDQVTMASALNALGVANMLAKAWDEARKHLEESQMFFKAAGYRSGVLMSLGNLGYLASGLGQYEEAKQLYQDAIKISLEIGDRRLRAALLDNLGDVAYALDDDPQAEKDFGESLKLTLEIGAIPSALLALAGIAKLRARAGHSAQALELLGLALNHAACDDETRQRAEPLLTELRAALPPATVEAALERGKAADLNTIALDLQQN